MARRKRHATLKERGERADASHAAAKRAVPAGLAVGAIVRTPVRIGSKSAVRGSNTAAAAAAAGTVALSANRARRKAKAKQGFKPIAYRGPVGRSRGGGGRGRQRRDKYGRFA